jgi:hypothetical protein
MVVSVHLKSGLIIEVASLEGDNYVVFPYYFTISFHLKSGLIIRVALGGRALIKRETTVLYCIFLLHMNIL